MFKETVEKKDREIKETNNKPEAMSAEKAKSLFTEELKDNKTDVSHEVTGTGEVKRGEKTELSDRFIEKFPFERQDAVGDAFADSPREFTSNLERYKERLSVNNSREKEGCYYYKGIVFMRPDMSNEEYSDVLRHEVSHFIDEQKGWCSEEIDYLNAVYDDSGRLDFNRSETKEYREQMLNELFDGDVCYNRHVSDILSAVSRNNPQLIFRYNIEGVPYYRHKNEYFDQSHNRENEIYADVMACIAENDEDTLNFLKKYFPNTYQETIKTIKE